MTDLVTISIVGMIQVVLVAGINAVVAWRNHIDTKEKIASVAEQVDTTHKQIDGRMSELLVAAKAQGAQDQRAETRQDAKDLRQDVRDESARQR